MSNVTNKIIVTADFRACARRANTGGASSSDASRKQVCIPRLRSLRKSSMGRLGAFRSISDVFKVWTFP